MTKYHALIPARGGSKRIVNKNLKKIKGKSLIEWTIEFALKQELISNIYLSTDIKIDFNVDPKLILVNRPKNLLDSSATLIDVINYVIHNQNLNYDDNLLILLPTAPLRVSSDLTLARKNFEEINRTKTLISVSVHTHPPELSWTLEKNNKLEPFINKSKDKFFSQKQRYPQRYFFDECIILDKVSSWLVKDRSLFGKSPLAQITPSIRAQPIDYPIHYEICKKFFPPFDERRQVLEW